MAKEKSEKVDIRIGFYKKKQKEAFITGKKAELIELFIDLTEDKKQLISPLIDEISFMFSELKELKEIIKRDGSVEYYQNGTNQWGKKKSASSEVYNTMIKNYASIYKQLCDFLPKGEAPPSDGFEDY